MIPKTHVEYPDGCNQITKNFVDKINEILASRRRSIVIDEYYLRQNNVYHTIYKIAVAVDIVVTIECFNNEGTGYYNTPEHYERLNIQRYCSGPGGASIAEMNFPFEGVSTVNHAIEQIYHD